MINEHPGDFNPRPPRGGRLYMLLQSCTRYGFQSTPPARGATPRPDRCIRPAQYFNPRPPRGGRRPPCLTPTMTPTFQSTPPARGATRPSTTLILRTYQFQSTPPARGATRNSIHRNNTQATISIHAPREGGDGQAQASQGDRRISIHAPREGGDCTGTGYTPWCLAISIHAPREGGDSVLRLQ